MNSIALWRLKTLLHDRNYETMIVVASPLGGWFLMRPLLLGCGWK